MGGHTEGLRVPPGTQAWSVWRLHGVALGTDQLSPASRLAEGVRASLQTQSLECIVSMWREPREGTPQSRRGLQSTRGPCEHAAGEEQPQMSLQPPRQLSA